MAVYVASQAPIKARTIVFSTKYCATRTAVLSHELACSAAIALKTGSWLCGCTCSTAASKKAATESRMCATALSVAFMFNEASSILCCKGLMKGAKTRDSGKSYSPGGRDMDIARDRKSGPNGRHLR